MFKNVASPFCADQPVFVLAEPEDVVIICGEFNSGVEIISESREPEQVFTVTKIIQHPDYKPTKVRQPRVKVKRSDIYKGTRLKAASRLLLPSLDTVQTKSLFLFNHISIQYTSILNRAK